MVCDLLLVHFDPFCVFLCFKVRCFWTLELTWILGFIPLITHHTFLWNFRSNIEQFAYLTDATSATIFNKTESTLFECECIWLESTNWGLYFNVPFWRRYCHFTWSSDPREDKAKGVPSFLSYSRPWVLVRPRELNPRPPAQQSRALPIELQNTQPHLTSIRWCKRGWRRCCSWRMLFGGRYFSSHLIRPSCFQGFVRFCWWKSNWSVSYLIQKHPHNEDT